MIKLRYEESIRGQQIFNVSPTLIIGLGGSGKEVLMRLRRLFYTNIREPGLPIIKYLWIDTDPKRQDIQKQDYDKISSSIYLSDIDIIDARVDPSDMEKYFNHKSKYQYIFEWLHNDISSLGPNAIMDGAGKVRPCGRLAFFHHYPAIRERIENKLESLDDPIAIDQTQEKFGLKVDRTRKNVFIIASIAGGTGSGMFIDTAFLLNSIDSNLLVTGILFLPSIFKDLERGAFKKVFYSNGYAALTELDYYMAPRVGLLREDEEDVYQDFTFKWDGYEHRVSSAPFYTIYFIGWYNNSGCRFHSYTEPFQMGAEFIHLEFTNSQFGDFKRSIRVNLGDYLINETRGYELNSRQEEIFSQYFPNRYSSFGLSFIKLDIERKRNAAAYFLGKSLVGFWKKSPENTDRVKNEVESALKIKDMPGKKWNKDTIEESLLRKPDTPEGIESLLNAHEDWISEQFTDLRNRISKRFQHQNIKGAYIFLKGELESFQQKITEQPDIAKWDDIIQKANNDNENIMSLMKRVNEIWYKGIERLNDTLVHNGYDSKKIIENAAKCLKDMESAFTNKFFKLISKPGEDQGKSGIKHAMEFCKRFRQRIEEISALFVEETPPNQVLELDIAPISRNDDLEKQLNFLNEARTIIAPLFRKTSVSYYTQATDATLKQHINTIRDNFLKTVKDIEELLQKFYRIRFHNFVQERVNGEKDRKRFEEGILNTLLRIIERYENRLNEYQEGLQELIDLQHSMFNSFNIDYDDVRYHIIRQVTNELWYENEIKKPLVQKYTNGEAMSFKDFLDRETEEYFKRILEIDPQKANEMDSLEIRKNGFQSLFDTVSNKIDKKNEWRFMKEELENFCFERMEGFFAETNADIEFQKHVEKHKREDLLTKICEMSDIWIKRFASKNSQGNSPLISVMGIPSMKDIMTADQSGSITTQFVNPDDRFIHEKGNIIFYQELAAFPLFQIEELWKNKKEYEELSKDLKQLNYRHLDYRLINRLREILPPQDQKETEGLFETGKTFMEGLILGCFVKDESIGSRGINALWMEAPREMSLEKIKLGVNLDHSIRMLTNTPKYLEILKRQIDIRKRTIRDQGRDLIKEQIALIEYYYKQVFPVLQRNGHKTITEIETNHHKLCKDLRESYLEEYIKKSNYIDINDSRLWEEIDSINLDEISEILSFKEDEAFAELRVLKDRIKK